MARDTRPTKMALQWQELNVRVTENAAIDNIPDHSYLSPEFSAHPFER